MQKFHPSARKQIAAAAVSCLILLAAVNFALPLVLPDQSAFLISLLVVLAAALYAAAAYLSTLLVSYSLEGGNLAMEKSALSLERRLIPIQSIDNVHVKTSFLGRLLSITDVYIDTPGGFGYELVMRDVPSQHADQLLAEVARAKKGA